MIKITVGNSYSKITNLSPKQEAELREILSYTVGGKSAYYSGFRIKRRSLLSKRGEFPTGLLARVLDHIKDNYEITRPIAPKMNFGYGFNENAYSWQNEATERAVNWHRGTISACTGTGKSRVIGMIANFIGLKTLVVVPSLEIKRQLSETLKDLKNVRVENIDSTALKTLTHFDVLIIDEAHHVAARTYQRLNKTAWAGIYYRYYLTATAFRNDDEETLLFESIAGQVIYNLDYKTAIKEKYIVPVESYYIDIPKQSTDANTWPQVYSQLVVNNTPRNEQISLLLLKLQASKSYTLCLVKEVKHGEILSEITGLPFVSGADDDSRDYIRQFNNGGIKVLIGTEGILGEGIDTKPCEFVVIAGLGKAKSQFMQKVGRAVRTYPGKESAKVVLFKDTSHRFTLRHYKEQAKIMKEEYGIIPIKLEGI